MKIQAISDLHLEKMRQGYYFQLPITDSDVVVLAGDIGAGTDGMVWARDESDRHDKPFIYVPGNHEYYDETLQDLDEKMHEMTGCGNVHLLNKGVYVHENVRFVGCTLWTDFSAYGLREINMISAAASIYDYAHIRFRDQDNRIREITPSDVLELHMDQREWLITELEKPFDGKTVVITHHGISRLCDNPRHPLNTLTNVFWSEMTELMMYLDVDLAINGHTHAFVDERVGDMRIYSNQSGYRRSADEEPQVAQCDFSATIDL